MQAVNNNINGSINKKYNFLILFITSPFLNTLYIYKQTNELENTKSLSKKI